MADSPRTSGEPLSQRARDVYRCRISPQVEVENDDRYVVVDVDSEDFENGDDFVEVLHRLKSRHPAAQAFGLRAGGGGRPVDRLGAFGHAAFRPEGTR